MEKEEGVKLRESLDPDKSILVFVHPKKTGGTSLQAKLASQYRGKFYGMSFKGCPGKSLLPQDLYHVPNGSCVAQHWPDGTYRFIEHRANFITLLRDPWKRIVSHYSYYCKYHPGQMGFQQYAHQPENINVYTSMMLTHPYLLTEVLILEHIEECLSRSRLLKFDWIGTKNKTRVKHSVTDRDMQEFFSLNLADIEFYTEAMEVAGCRPKV